MEITHGRGSKSYEDKCILTGNIYTKEAKDRKRRIIFKNVKYSHADNCLVNVLFEDRPRENDCTLRFVIFRLDTKDHVLTAGLFKFDNEQFIL